MTTSTKKDPQANVDVSLNDIAGDALQCIEKVAEGAEAALHGRSGGGPQSFASVNTFTDVKQVQNIQAISQSERDALYELLRQPVIARVEYVDEDGRPGTIFVTRTTPRPVPGYKIASYRSALGTIASRRVGEELEVRIGGVEHDVEIVNTARLRPARTDQEWDSRDNEITLSDRRTYTVISLRELLLPEGDHAADDAWDAWELEGQEANVLEGIRRAVLSHMGLRDQPILDQKQDEIFRLPISARCFLSGPPGTGKTTTLIRRLGQKIDLDDAEALTAAERGQIERASQESGTDHRTSWAMFSPTELLRQYVKEAFAREGFAASDHHIHTWDDFRSDVARSNLHLLRTSTGGGAFHRRESDGHLNVPLVTSEAAEWFDDFDAFFRDELYTSLRADATWLAEHDNPDISQLGERLVALLERSPSGAFIGAMPLGLSSLIPDIRAQLDVSRDDAQKIVTRTLNRLVHEDKGFPAALKGEIERQLITAEPDEPDDPDAEYDSLEDDENAVPVSRSVNKEEVRRRYTQAITSLARARRRRGRVSEKGRSGQLLAWLGENRIPGRDDLVELGAIAAGQSRLRRFASFDALVRRTIAGAYRRFRQQRSEEGRWYLSIPSRSSDICWQELDLLVLATLRAAGDLLSGHRGVPGADLPGSGWLGAVRALYKNQILVDEATDFSVLQLACMYELSHPLLRSFFLCGDVNQRLTGWGIKSYDAIDWIARDIERRRIVVSYRQSGELVRLARAVAALSGTAPDEIVLPERLDIEGLPPVWKTQLASNAATAEWLSARIREIENIVGKVPTIAVLVNDEADVEPLAAELREQLKEINLSVEACRDGKAVGKDHAVRVFNIQHIKGLEFEAVFFTDLDKTIESHPDLFLQYLYVGSTRAATYLGVTLRGDCPDVLSPLAAHFHENWPT